MMNEEAMSLESSFYPQSLCPNLEISNLDNQSIYRLISERYGLTPNYATDTIELSIAGTYEAKELKINEGVPVVLVTRLSYLIDNTPIEFTLSTHRGDRFKSVIHRTQQQLR
jgi:GntR family transcriptional regulator